MNFNNLTNEQVEWLEQKIKEAYEEGVYDSAVSCGEPVGDWGGSMAKYDTCHFLAERFMKSVDFDFEGMYYGKD
jgi:hypothetical protein